MGGYRILHIKHKQIIQYVPIQRRRYFVTRMKYSREGQMRVYSNKIFWPSYCLVYLRDILGVPLVSDTGGYLDPSKNELQALTR